MSKQEVLIERFKIKENKPPFNHVLQIMLDDKEISIADLVKIANQLASALNDRGTWFEVKK